MKHDVFVSSGLDATMPTLQPGEVKCWEGESPLYVVRVGNRLTVVAPGNISAGQREVLSDFGFKPRLLEDGGYSRRIFFYSEPLTSSQRSRLRQTRLINALTVVLATLLNTPTM